MTRRSAGDRIGEYVLERPLGRGSFGEVWQARHRVLDATLVAIKLPRDARALARLRDEGALSRRVESDAAVKLVGLDLEHDPPYLALQFVDGGSLRQTLEGGALPPRRALYVAQRVFSALRAAHEAKVIHRDVKPENILIDRSGTAFLTDFGLAAAIDARGSSGLGSLGSHGAGAVAGTLRYLSPEQRDPARGVDERSDLYSAGLVLFEMLTGTLPEGGEVPSDLVPGLEKGFDHVFSRCYARLERRFRNAASVLEALSRLEERLLVPAPRPREGLRPVVVARPAHRPSSDPNLIPWEEARAILRVQERDLQAFVERAALVRVPHEGRLLFRRSDVVDLRGRLRRIVTPSGLDFCIVPPPPRPVRPEPRPAPPEPYPWAPVPDRLRPAGALVRAFAFGIDALVIAALAAVLGTELFAGPALVVAYAAGGPDFFLAPGMVDAASLGVLAFLYFSLTIGLAGRTFGKWLFGLRVTDPSGEPIGLGRAAARTLGYAVSATPLGLGFLGVVLHPEHRGFHDLVADSVVTHE